MRKAFGLIEMLIIILLFSVLYFVCTKTNKNRNPFDDGVETPKIQAIDKKIKKIEDTKLLKQKIEENLNKGY